MSETSFAAFYQRVLQEPALQATLRATSEQRAFIRQVVALGQELGYSFTEETVAAAMQAQRRTWIERWLQ